VTVRVADTCNAVNWAKFAQDSGHPGIEPTLDTPVLLDSRVHLTSLETGTGRMEDQ
jgi:hypothetical protein